MTGGISLERLFEAASVGDLELLRRYVDAGECVNASDASGETALTTASAFGQLEAAEFLLANGAEVDPSPAAETTPLLEAAMIGAAGVVALLLQHGAGVDRTRRSSDPDIAGRTPLMCSLYGYRSGRVIETNALLLKHGADPNAADEQGRTALMHLLICMEQKAASAAAQHLTSGSSGDGFEVFEFLMSPQPVHEDPDSLSVLRLLLSSGANPAVVDKFGTAPATFAFERGFEQAASLLDSRGVLGSG